MVRKQGTVFLPLHHGKAPRWLFKRMVHLTREVSEIIILEYGKDEFIKRISNPFFFQALGCLVGFDWHSSGLTTTLTGAIKSNKEVLEEYGIFIAGGKGKEALKTLDEIKSVEKEHSLDLEKVKEESRLIARTDNNLLQDGYDLYHHFVIFTEKEKYAIVQQGMNEKNKYARRYHWTNLKEEFSVFDGTREGIDAKITHENVLNISSKKSKDLRKSMLELIQENPVKILKMFDAQTSLNIFFKKERIMIFEKRHSLKFVNLSKTAKKNLIEIWKQNPTNFKELVGLKKVGKATIRALALTAQIIYGSDIDWQDPAKFSFAHGGKDGWPYPVDRKIYDTTIKILEDVIKNSKIKREEKKLAMKRLINLASS